MSTAVLLEQIKDIIHTEIQSSEKRQELKFDTLELKIGELDSKINNVQETLELKIGEVQKTVDIIQEVMLENHTLLEQRVEVLEEKVGIVTPNQH